MLVRGVIVTAMLLAACGEDRYLVVEYQDKPLAAVDPSAWTLSAGEITEVSFRVSPRMARSVSIRLRLETADSGTPVPLALTAASAEQYTENPCTTTVPVCTDGTCLVQIDEEDLFLGDCVVKLRAEDGDGFAHDTCWYHGLHDTLDHPDPAGALAQVKVAVESTRQRCAND
jgi:hypothetical protein